MDHRFICSIDFADSLFGISNQEFAHEFAEAAFGYFSVHSCMIWKGGLQMFNAFSEMWADGSVKSNKIYLGASIFLRESCLNDIYRKPHCTFQLSVCSRAVDE